MLLLKVKDHEFKKYQEYIQKLIGIKFPDTKRSLLEGRLGTHIGKMGLKSFGEYFEYLTTAGDREEINFFIHKITTHTTHFFREKQHFVFLVKEGLEYLNQTFNFPRIKLLSLGSSTGEEIYTLSMILTLQKEMGKVNDFELHAADVAKEALLSVKEGVYKKDHLPSIPKKYLKYFDITDDHIEAKDLLRSKIRVFLLNGSQENQKFPDQYHIIFCRNMLIYFDKDSQHRIIHNIERHSLKGGLVFIGHTEAIHSIKHSLKRVKSSVYRS